jgi:hypothetical protein
MDEQELEAIDKARDILGEFFGNFAFCVVVRMVNYSMTTGIGL